MSFRILTAAILAILVLSACHTLKGGPETDMSSTTVPEPTKTTARLALMRAVPEKWNLDANFAVFLKLLDEASQQNAEILITPEGWLDGYCAADTEHSTPEKVRGMAQDLSSSRYLQQVAEEAKKRGMYICFGFTSMEDGKPYNAAGLWSSEGGTDRRLPQSPSPAARSPIHARGVTPRLADAVGAGGHHDLRGSPLA